MIVRKGKKKITKKEKGSNKTIASKKIERGHSIFKGKFKESSYCY